MTTVGIGASGFVGIAEETVPGTYVAPDKFFPLRSESLAWTQGTVWRRVIRGTADVIGAVPGNGNVEGDIDMELLEDVLPYFLRASRGTLSKTGSGPYTYEFVGGHGALPTATLSITVVRNGVAFGYTGCVVSSMSFGVDDGMATSTFSILGREEEPVAVPGSPVYSADDQPFGAGQWSIQIPTATQVFDSDNFSLEIEDSGSVQNRLQTSRGAAFIAYGERNVTLSVDRDFTSRAQFDNFKELTKQSITVEVEKDEDARIAFTVPGTVIDSFDVSLGGVGDLVRGSTTYQGTHDATTGAAYKVEIVTSENLTSVT